MLRVNKISNKGTKKPIFTAILIVLAICAIAAVGMSTFFTNKEYILIPALSLLFLILLAVLIRMIVLGPRKQAGWGLWEPKLWIRKLKVHRVLGYVAGILTVIGLLGILAAGGWQKIFSARQSFTVTEGETTVIPFTSEDSLHLYELNIDFYPESQWKAISDYQVVVITSVEGLFDWDTAEIRFNKPLDRGSDLLYFQDYGFSDDSVYLVFKLRLPDGAEIGYEFPPDGVIDDPRFPMILSLEDFKIDRTTIWEIPEVTVYLMRRGELILKQFMRPADSVIIDGFTVIFDHVNKRPSVTLLCIRDRSWWPALIGISILIVGLALGFASRAATGFGRKDD